MDLSRVTLSLFDFLSYLLPGYVILFASALVEATFLETSLLNLESLNNHILLSSISSYFLGHGAHAIASELSVRRPNWFDNKELGLRKPLFNHVRSTVVQVFNLDLNRLQLEKLTTLETYQLADSYLAASEKVAERNSLLVREGFAKTSMVAFAVLCAFLTIGAATGGVHVHPTSDMDIRIGLWSTVALAALAFFFSLLFWRRYTFFNRLKLNTTYLLFLGLVERGHADLPGHQSTTERQSEHTKPNPDKI